MAHMDVVEAKESDWKYSPFKFREDGGWYLGRASNDNKAAGGLNSNVKLHERSKLIRGFRVGA